MSEVKIIEKIKGLLGMEVEQVSLSQAKLDDGITIVESENFAEGEEIVIITEDGKVAMPVGEYAMEDGKILVVEEEGIIAAVKEAAEEEEEEVEVDESPEAKDEEEYMEEKNPTPKKIVDAITKETFFNEIEQLKTENENLKKELEKLTSEKVEEPVKEVELKEETPKPILQNPENKSKKIEGFKYSQNRMETTLDRVMSKLSK